MNLIATASSRTIFDSLDITPATKQDYLARLPQFLGFVRNNGVTRDLLLDYKKYLRERADLGVASKNKYLAVARITLKELYRQGAISVDLSVGVKSFQQSTRHKVQGLNEEEVNKICEYLRNTDDSFKTIRLRAIISLLLFQGLRTVEVCRLNTDDIDLAYETIWVLGKGKDDKEPIRLHPETTKALRAYLRSSQVKDGPLFTSLLGHTKAQRLSTRGLRLIVKQLFTQLCIERTVHGTRHYFTTKLIKEFSDDILTVAKYTRHNSIETLNIYNDAIIEQQSSRRLIKALSHKIH